MLATSKTVIAEWFYFYDANGNVRSIVDAQGNSVIQYNYNGFGELDGATLHENRFQFSTKFYNKETELYYYGYRYYDPSDGRWLKRDPIGEHGGLNLYTMVRNNAVRYLDALGLELILQEDLGTRNQIQNYNDYYDANPTTFNLQYYKQPADRMESEMNTALSTTWPQALQTLRASGYDGVFAQFDGPGTAATYLDVGHLGMTTKYNPVEERIELGARFMITVQVLSCNCEETEVALVQELISYPSLLVHELKHLADKDDLDDLELDKTDNELRWKNQAEKRAVNTANEYREHVGERLRIAYDDAWFNHLYETTHLNSCPSGWSHEIYFD